MKKIVLGLLTVLCFGCQNGADDMHFGPGPEDETNIGGSQECSSCGHDSRS